MHRWLANKQGKLRATDHADRIKQVKTSASIQNTVEVCTNDGISCKRPYSNITVDYSELTMW